MKTLKTKTIGLFALATSLAAPALSAAEPVYVDGNRSGFHGGIMGSSGFYSAPLDHGRVYDQPIRVFVEFDSLRDYRNERGVTTRFERRQVNRADRARIDRSEANVLNQISQQLPGGLRLVQNPRRADIIVRAKPINAQINFRVVDVDRKRKTKGKRYNRRSFVYDRVEERASIRYAYDYTIRIPGAGRYQKTLASRVSDDFIYARNVQGFGPAAYNGDRITIGRVQELVSRDTPQFRRQIIRGLKAQAEAEVAFKIAQIIRFQAEASFQPASYVIPTDGRFYGRDRFNDRDDDRFDDWEDDREDFDDRNRRTHRLYPAGQPIGQSRVGDAVRVGVAASVIALLAAEIID